MTYERRPFILDNVDLLWEAVDSAHMKDDFDLIAWAILPDHFHFLLDVKNSNISNIMQRTKLSYSMRFRKRYGSNGKVWQRGFWDHIIRDEKDLNNHLNYIHYNPVKHNLAKCPHEWPYSTFHKWMKNGYYQQEWLCVCKSGKLYEPDFDNINGSVGE